MGMLNALFGCSHKNLSFPITIRGQHRSGPVATRTTYVVCLDCGHEFPYDWNQMKVVRDDRRARPASGAMQPHRAA